LVRTLGAENDMAGPRPAMWRLDLSPLCGRLDAGESQSAALISIALCGQLDEGESQSATLVSIALCGRLDEGESQSAT